MFSDGIKNVLRNMYVHKLGMNFQEVITKLTNMSCSVVISRFYCNYYK